jgi:hypothetical protein
MRYHESIAPKLMYNALEHSKLARRYGEKDCTLEEKQYIKKRIDELRDERDRLLEENKALMQM